MQERHGVFRNAEGIRGLACLIVLTIHTCAMFFPDSGQYLSGSAKIGVWLFFVLSAFLLTNHLLMGGTLTREKMTDYVIGRLLRIVPLYLVAVMAYRLLGTAGIDSSSDMLHAATLTAGFAHLWTIPVEMKFYLLLALMITPIATICGRWGTGWAFSFILAIGLLSVIIFPPRHTPESSISLRWYVPCFLAGMAAAVIYPNLKVRSRLCTVVNLAMAICLVFSTNYFRGLLGGSPDPKWLMDKFVPIGFAWATLVVLNVDVPGAWSKFWNMQPLRLMGRWSYSIYLFHWLIVATLAGTHRGSIVFAAIGFISSVLLGAFIYRSIERPLLKLRQLIRVATGQATAPEKPTCAGMSRNA